MCHTIAETAWSARTPSRLLFECILLAKCSMTSSPRCLQVLDFTWIESKRWNQIQAQTEKQDHSFVGLRICTRTLAPQHASCVPLETSFHFLVFLSAHQKNRKTNPTLSMARTFLQLMMSLTCKFVANIHNHENKYTHIHMYIHTT